MNTVGVYHFHITVNTVGENLEEMSEFAKANRMKVTVIESSEYKDIMFTGYIRSDKWNAIETMKQKTQCCRDHGYEIIRAKLEVEKLNIPCIYKEGHIKIKVKNRKELKHLKEWTEEINEILDNVNIHCANNPKEKGHGYIMNFVNLRTQNWDDIRYVAEIYSGAGWHIRELKEESVLVDTNVKHDERYF